MRDRIRGEIGRAAGRAAVGDIGAERPQSIDHTFTDSGEPAGLMQVMETENFKAELKFLRQPDTGDPLHNPWHVKVVGPEWDGRERGWTVRPVWSGSYDDEDEAVEAAERKLKQEQRRFERRRDRRGESPPEFPQEVAHDGGVPETMWAVFDPNISGFVKSGFMGKQVWEDEAGARKTANEKGGHVVKVTKVD